jgi:hypothetical protein
LPDDPPAQTIEVVTSEGTPVAKFRRDEDDREEPERRRPAGGNTLLVVALAAGGLVLLACVGAAVVGFFFARTTVREAEIAQVEVAERVAQIEAEQAAQDVRSFRAKVAHYLTEARAAANLMAGEPSVEDAEKAARRVMDLQDNLPDVPPEIDRTGKVAGKLKDIRVTTAMAAGEVRRRHGFAELGDKGEANDATTRLAKSVAAVNAAADEVEAVVGIRAKP